MREIKFRQWDSTKKRMYHNIGAIDKGWYGPAILKFDENPLMQFTGLFDKNGNEIYEGDVVTLYFKDGLKQNGTIVWNEKGARFEWQDKEGYWGLSDRNEFEVIGNIYENPELLK